MNQRKYPLSSIQLIDAGHVIQDSHQTYIVVESYPNAEAALEGGVVLTLDGVDYMMNYMISDSNPPNGYWFVIVPTSESGVYNYSLSVV